MKKIVIALSIAFFSSAAFAQGFNFGTDMDWNTETLSQGIGQGDNIAAKSTVADTINVWSSGTIQTDGCTSGCGASTFSMGFDSNQRAGNDVVVNSSGAGNVSSAAGSQTRGFNAFGGAISFPSFSQ